MQQDSDLFIPGGRKPTQAEMEALEKRARLASISQVASSILSECVNNGLRPHDMADEVSDIAPLARNALNEAFSERREGVFEQTELNKLRNGVAIQLISAQYARHGQHNSEISQSELIKLCFDAAEKLLQDIQNAQ